MLFDGAAVRNVTPWCIKKEKKKKKDWRTRLGPDHHLHVGQARQLLNSRLRVVSGESPIPLLAQGAFTGEAIANGPRRRQSWH